MVFLNTTTVSALFFTFTACYNVHVTQLVVYKAHLMPHLSRTILNKPIPLQQRACFCRPDLDCKLKPKSMVGRLTSKVRIVDISIYLCCDKYLMLDPCCLFVEHGKPY